MTPRILLVEDTPDIALWLGTALRQGGMQVEFATDGHAADRCLQPGHGFDAVLLDLQLPGQDGLSVLQALRGRGDAVPVLVLTARASVPDRVLGLNMGADDYLPKPFEPRELLARIKAILRRQNSAPDSAQQLMQFGSLVIDRDARRVSVKGQACDLTSYQYDLLLALAERAGRVLTRDQIMEAVRGRELEAFDRSIDVHMGRIRAAIEADPKAPQRILTVRGVGYVFARQQD